MPKATALAQRGAQGLLWELSHLAGRYRPAFISDAKRHHAAIRLVVSTMSGGRPTKFARLLGHLGLPRLHVSAEPVGTVRWGHASAPLSIAPLPVPTGIRDPASSSQEAFATRAIGKTRASLLPASPLVNPLTGFNGKSDRPGRPSSPADIKVVHMNVSSLFGLCSFRFRIGRNSAKADCGFMRRGLSRRGCENTYMCGWRTFCHSSFSLRRRTGHGRS